MSKRLRSKPASSKSTKEIAFLDYGNPEACITVGLLPPNLDEDGFLIQAKAHVKAFQSGLRCYQYEKGVRDGKPFEKPTFSVAYLEFTSIPHAKRVNEQLHEKVFLEPGTGDNMSCQCNKPVVGRVFLPPAARENSINHGPTYEAFCKAREEKGQGTQLRAVIEGLKEKLRIKSKTNSKSKLKSLKKRKSDEKPAALLSTNFSEDSSARSNPAQKISADGNLDRKPTEKRKKSRNKPRNKSVNTEDALSSVQKSKEINRESKKAKIKRDTESEKIEAAHFSRLRPKPSKTETNVPTNSARKSPVPPNPSDTSEMAKVTKPKQARKKIVKRKKDDTSSAKQESMTYPS